MRTVSSNGVVCPNIIEERPNNIAVLDIYSRLLNNRIIFLGSEIDDPIANAVQAQLLYLDSVNPGEPIDMYINSPGGVVSSGLAIYDTIKYIQSPVNTICTGMAASMAAIILASGDKGMRAALPHAKIMIHQPSGGAFGQCSDVTIAAEEIKKIRKELENILVSESGQSLSRIHKDSERDFWMSAEEALQYGLIDKIVQRTC